MRSAGFILVGFVMKLGHAIAGMDSALANEPDGTPTRSLGGDDLDFRLGFGSLPA
ncbi:MAG: hypothetical protein Q8N18_20905 [Opitutaceae bacterium]|nr:hypothetical protein [Opitutaceae bacterium]